ATRRRRACTTSGWLMRPWPTRCPSTATTTAPRCSRRRTSTSGPSRSIRARNTSRRPRSGSRPAWSTPTRRSATRRTRGAGARGGAPAASVAFEYKGTAGEGRLHVLVAYEDAKGAARAATLEVTGGDPPGAWTPWEGELLSLRPRPSRVREVRIVSEGGTVLL